jgi:hypothetical protein
MSAGVMIDTFDGWFDFLAFIALALAFGVGLVALWR